MAMKLGFVLLSAVVLKGDTLSSTCEPLTCNFVNESSGFDRVDEGYNGIWIASSDCELGIDTDKNDCYLFVNQNDQQDSTVALLRSPCYSPREGEEPVLSFDYHKYFKLPSKWFIDVKTTSYCTGTLDSTLLERIKEQSFKWDSFTKKIPTTGPFRILIEAHLTTTVSFKKGIGVDNISLSGVDTVPSSTASSKTSMPAMTEYGATTTKAPKENTSPDFPVIAVVIGVIAFALLTLLLFCIYYNKKCCFKSNANTSYMEDGDAEMHTKQSGGNKEKDRIKFTSTSENRNQINDDNLYANEPKGNESLRNQGSKDDDRLSVTYAKPEMKQSDRKKASANEAFSPDESNDDELKSRSTLDDGNVSSKTEAISETKLSRDEAVNDASSRQHHPQDQHVPYGDDYATINENPTFNQKDDVSSPYEDVKQDGNITRLQNAPPALPSDTLTRPSHHGSTKVGESPEAAYAVANIFGTPSSEAPQTCQDGDGRNEESGWVDNIIYSSTN